jgi:hypothetical protein
MKKHGLGIALFVLIVTVSMFIAGYFVYQHEPDCGYYGDERCGATPKPVEISENEFPDYKTADIGVRLDYVEASAKFRKVNARVELDWRGMGTRPRNVWLQMKFHNSDGSPAGWTSKPVKIIGAFNDADLQNTETAFECPQCESLPRNLYATVTVWNRNGPGQKQTYKLNEMKPVLMGENR